MAVVGYARVSTKSMYFVIQLGALAKVETKRIYQEKASGAGGARVELGLSPGRNCLQTGLARQEHKTLAGDCGKAYKGAGHPQGPPISILTQRPLTGKLMLTVRGSITPLSTERQADGIARRRPPGLSSGANRLPGK